MGLKNDVTRRKEHETIRQDVGYYDFTHETLAVTGPESEALLDYIFANTLSGLDIGKAKYTQMLNKDGIIIDDLIIFHVDKDEYWLSTLDIAQMLKWFEKHSGEFNANYEDITDQWSMYAVQGPNSRDLIQSISEDDITNMPWFSIQENTIERIPVKIARAGFTGELGYEIFVHPNHFERIEDILIQAGSQYNLSEITSDVTLNSIPREKGYVIMSDVEGLNLYEAGFGWAADFNTDFIGKVPTLEAQENEVTRKLRGFVLDETDDDVAINAGDTISFKGEDVGEVRTFTYGYTVEKYIGYALVDITRVELANKVTIGDYEAEITKRIFYDPDNERLTS